MKPKIFFLLILTFSIFHTTYSIATVRYVSKTGSSTPPYTSWETAADSIQKAINICVAGDTVIVANGVYREHLIINTEISLIGTSVDSTVIDGSQIQSPPLNSLINFNVDGEIKYFLIKGNEQNEFMNGVVTITAANIDIEFCRILNFFQGVVLGNSSSSVRNCITTDCERAIRDECPNNNCYGVYNDNVIISNNTGTSPAVDFSFGGYPTFTNNIVLEEGTTSWVGLQSVQKPGAIIKNNLVSNYQKVGMQIGAVTSDTTYIVNNNVINITEAENYYDGAIITGTGYRTQIKNNIITETYVGISGFNSNDSTKSDYTLFWNVDNKVWGNASYGDSNIVADPMFVNDTLPRINSSYDLHLQKYSPAIDAGDPNILDVDGSRSDIGMFGGPLGQKYTYMDLAPKPPRNLTASLDSGLIHLKWNKNTEADLFRYRIYRDTVPDFIYDITKLIATVADTFYYDDVPDKFNSGNYYYKLTAIDTAVNQSAASEEKHINVTGIPEAPPVVVEHYRLLQNYPNPFNPTTTIPYRLKEGGYVKIMVYNLVGELVRVLVNQHQSAGYYEVEFNPNKSERKKAEGYVEFETGYYGNVASGIYLYRIEVIGEGRIPVYSDMKKMILLK